MQTLIHTKDGGSEYVDVQREAPTTETHFAIRGEDEPMQPFKWRELTAAEKILAIGVLVGSLAFWTWVLCWWASR